MPHELHIRPPLAPYQPAHSRNGIGSPDKRQEGDVGNYCQNIGHSTEHSNALTRRGRAGGLWIRGQRFGELVACFPVAKTHCGILWACRCDCGRWALRHAAQLRYRVKRGGQPCCQLCKEELWAGLREQRRRTSVEMYRYLWETYGALYLPDYDFEGRDQPVVAAMEATSDATHAHLTHLCELSFIGDRPTRGGALRDGPSDELASEVRQMSKPKNYRGRPNWDWRPRRERKRARNIIWTSTNTGNQ